MIEHKVVYEEQGCRADKIVANIFEKVSYAFLQKIFRTKKVKVNGKSAHASDRLNEGDELKIFARKESSLAHEAVQTNSNELRKNNAEDQKLAKKFKQMIIFSNDDFIAINKPEGLSVQKGTNVTICIETFMKAFEKTAEGIDCDFKLVHRLDKDTSGILLIAKNRRAAQKLTKLFRENKIHKTYLAVVDGKIKKGGIIRNFLRKAMIGNEEKIIITEDKKLGQQAITKYYPKKINNNDNNSEFKYCTLLELQPQTGRKHQLRVHCADVLKAPILGDKKYNKNAVHNKMFLHAYKLKIDDSDIKAEITAEIPKYFPKIQAIPIS